MGIIVSLCDKCGGRTEKKVEKCHRYCQCDKCVKYYVLECDTAFGHKTFFPELYNETRKHNNVKYI